MKLVRPETDPVREKFAQARKELSAALIERDEEVDLVLTALVANEHVLLVGPPGCGKPPDTPQESGVPASNPGETARPAGASPTALEVDAWGLRRGRDLLAE